jgi:hypothetical protein
VGTTGTSTVTTTTSAVGGTAVGATGAGVVADIASHAESATAMTRDKTITFFMRFSFLLYENFKVTFKSILLPIWVNFSYIFFTFLLGAESQRGFF